MCEPMKPAPPVTRTGIGGVFHPGGLWIVVRTNSRNNSFQVRMVTLRRRFLSTLCRSETTTLRFTHDQFFFESDSDIPHLIEMGD
jgi:hypothetical protein